MYIIITNCFFFPINGDACVSFYATLSLKNKILQKQDVPFNEKIRCFIFCKIIITPYIYPTSNVLYGDVVQYGSSFGKSLKKDR